MIHVDFDARLKTLDEDQRNWFNDWKVRAKTATDDLLKAWEARRQDPNNLTYDTYFDKPAHSNVWGQLKDWLLENVFYRKCAYCETPVARSIFHAEHYRPKGRVTADGKKVKINDDKDNPIDHPGYFWLAFHWKNLLPSCALCNTVNGKRNQFPIPQGKSYLSIFKRLTKAELKTLIERFIQSPTWPDIYYFQPEDLDNLEGRLLLHPYIDQPKECLRFDDFGIVIAIGNDEQRARGEWSIKVYNLNGGDLPKLRRDLQGQAYRAYETASQYHYSKGRSIDDARKLAKEDVRGYVEGKEPYSAAVLDFLSAQYPNYF